MAEQELQVAEKKEIAPEKGEFTREGIYFSPAVDIFDNERDLIVLADMPGVGPDEIEIDLREDTLTILGKVTESPEGEILLNEFQVGNYYRTFRISDSVDRSKISASISDGVLKLTLPKAEKAVPRKIPISAG